MADETQPKKDYQTGGGGPTDVSTILVLGPLLPFPSGVGGVVPGISVSGGIPSAGSSLPGFGAGGSRAPRPAPRPPETGTSPTPVVVQTPAPDIPPVQSPGSLLEDLLNKPLKPPAMPELDALLRGSGNPELYKLLQKPLTRSPPKKFSLRNVLPRIAGTVTDALLLLLYPQEAGSETENEFALTNYMYGGLPGYATNQPPTPPDSTDASGLTEFVPNVGYISPDTITVTAPPAGTTPALDAPPTIGITVDNLGNPTLVGPVPTPGALIPRGLFGPTGSPSSRPVSKPRPQPKPAPLPLLGGAPGFPVPTQTPKPAPKPSTTPSVALHPQPMLVSACNCNKGTKTKKKKKPRDKCYKGTYYELRNGLRKYKREEIPCR